MIRTEAIDEAFQGERELGGQLCFVDDRGPRERPQPTIGVGEGEFPGEGIQESLVRGIAFSRPGDGVRGGSSRWLVFLPER